MTALHARPGEVLAEGEGYRWIAYGLSGETVAAVYVAGHLLRRDHEGWWIADYWGKRRKVHGDPVDRLRGTAPDGWPVHPEHDELAGGGHDD